MKKHPLLLFFLLIFLITTSTTCENYDYEETYVPCTLTGVEVYSWDNAGAEPQVPIEQKIKKETYLLKIRLLSNAGTQPKQDITNNTYKLKDGIVKINIYKRTSEQRLSQRNSPTLLFCGLSLPIDRTSNKRLYPSRRHHSIHESYQTNIQSFDDSTTNR